MTDRPVDLDAVQLLVGEVAALVHHPSVTGGTDWTTIVLKSGRELTVLLPIGRVSVALWPPDPTRTSTVEP